MERCGVPRVSFWWKIFLMKIMPFNAVLRADSEYHIHFAIKLINNNENLYETLIFAEKT
jgi:hypothetical protein